MLAHTVNGPYRERDFAAWLHSAGAPSDKAKLSVLEGRWQEMAERVTLLEGANAGPSPPGDGADEGSHLMVEHESDRTD
jgi:hypothetical protein